jgi:hypothetical protein
MIAHLILSIFILVLIANMATLNGLPSNTLFVGPDNKESFVMSVHAQSDSSSMSPNELQQLAKNFLSTLSELQNQSSTNESLLVDGDGSTNSNNVDMTMQQLKTDTSGNYKNPAYGILDFVIPAGWYGSERQWSGDKSLSLDMHEGTEDEYMNRLSSPISGDARDVNDIIPKMTLESTDKAQLQYTQSLLEGVSSTSDTGSVTSLCMNEGGSKRYLEPNSTATINGKVFDIFTMECSYSSDLGTTIVVSKTYKHETPERIYSLALEVYKDLFTNGQNPQNLNLQNTINFEIYSPIIDNTVQTLKLE